MIIERALACILLSVAAVATSAATRITLTTQCPPSFEKNRRGLCELRTLYQLYPESRGFGGQRVALPPVRDGFSPKEIDLGRLLFFDPILSSNQETSCAHCHYPTLGFADARERAIGRGAVGVGAERHGGEALTRAAPTLWNVAFLQSFDWDGRAATLEDQATAPLFAADEMGNTKEALQARLNANETYRRLFAEAFTRPETEAITIERVGQALAAFESSLVSINSRYDRYAHGDSTALSAVEIHGLKVFNGFVTRCSQCHTPPLFTNGELAVIGAPEPPGVSFDHGAANLAPNPALNGAFRVPTLRNIAVTAPYMHSGAFHTLEEVVAFYDTPHPSSVADGERVVLHWNIHGEGLGLSPEDKAALVAFMRALTDQSLMPRIPTVLPSGLPPVPPSVALEIH